MELNQKISELEAEVKLLKHEVRETLLDIRESILDHENPFTSVGSATPTVVEIRQGPTPQTEVQWEPPTAGAERPDERQDEELEREGGLNQDPKPRLESTTESRGGRQESETSAKAPGPVDEGPRLPVPSSPLQTNGRRNDFGPLDLATIAGLGQWADSGITRIGRKRIEAIVQIYRMTGHLPPGLDEVLIELTRLVDGEEPVAPVTMRECIGALVQLDSLLGRSGTSGATLLSFFLDDAAESTHR